MALPNLAKLTNVVVSLRTGWAGGRRRLYARWDLDCLGRISVALPEAASFCPGFVKGRASAGYQYANTSVLHVLPYNTPSIFTGRLPYDSLVPEFW